MIVPLLLAVFKQLFIYAMCVATGIQVYKTMNKEQISFKEFLKRKKLQVFVLFLFMISAVAFGLYYLQKIPISA